MKRTDAVHITEGRYAAREEMVRSAARMDRTPAGGEASHDAAHVSGVNNGDY